MQITSRNKISALFVAASISMLSVATFGTTFTEIASTNSAVPNGQPGETFGNGIAIRPAVADGTVYFIAGGNQGTGGLYSGNGGPLSIVADTNTNIPNSSNKFPFITDNPSASGSNVSFDLGTNAGVYASIGGSLVTIADTNTTAPGESFKFSSFNNSSISGNNVAFSASDIISRPGIYSSLNLAPLALVANTSTAVPGGIGTFGSFGQPAIDGTNVVFEASGTSATPAIYSNPTGNGGTITAVVPQNTAIPNGTGNFSGFGRVVANDGNIAFVGTGSGGQEGVYSDIGNTLAAVADGSTLIPGGGADTFAPSSFGNISISGDDVAFTASGAHESGLYLDEDGTLSKVIAAGDTLDGFPVQAVYFFSNGLDGSDLTFTADFGGFQAVFLAAVPEPTSMALLTLSAVTFLQRRRRNASRG